MKRLTLLLCLFLLICTELSAQQLCASDSMHRIRMSDPIYRDRFNNANLLLRKAVHQRRPTLASTTIYTIPVVFHVMNRGESVGTGTNLSDDDIRAALKQLNERYRKISGSVGDGNSVDMEIQFALAVRDPDGNCTNGINRIDMSAYQNYMDNGMDGPNGMDEYALKPLSFWDSNHYANVWIVSKAPDGLGGFAHLAPEHGSAVDGVVITQGSLNTALLTHEFGHYLNLLHIFGEWNGTCVPESDCSLAGDFVCDTPPQEPFASCELAPNSCVPGQMLEAVNYMSYSCQREFTAGQQQRALYALTVMRSSLLGENGNMALVPIGLPAPEFTSNLINNCLRPGAEIQLLDRTPCFPNTLINTPSTTNVTYNWTVTNGVDIILTSTEQNPKFVLPVAGNFDVSLHITSPAGDVMVTRPNFVIVVEPDELASCTAQTTDIIDLTRVDDIGIREVILNNLHHISGTAVQDASAGLTNANGYADFSCNVTAALEPFTDYSLKIRLSDYYDEYVYVYIDFDNNGFTQDDLVSTAYVPLGSGLYELPAFTTPGFPIFNTKLRMRIIDVDSSDPSPEPCGNIGYYGQIQDYSIIFNNLLPIAKADTVVIDEDHSIEIPVLVNDLDPDGTVRSGSIDLDLVNPFFQTTVITNEGKWTVSNNKINFIPKANFNGEASIEYTILDNRYATSLPAKVVVNINPINDPPSFTKGSDQLVNGDTNVQHIMGWATTISAGPLDESIQTLAFTLTNNQNNLFSAQPSIDGNGNLSFTPAANVTGSATVLVKLKDNGGTDDGGIDTSQLSFNITINNGYLTLPVSWLYFKGKPITQGRQLSWATAVEKNAKAFVVERSMDGKIFTTIGELAASGNSSSPLGYVYVDRSGIATSAMVLYYRLKQMDLNGQYNYSEIVPVNFDTNKITTGAINIYPNPFTSILNVNVGDLDQPVQFRLYDLTGQICYQKQLLAKAGKVMLSDLPNLSIGIYILEVKTADQLKTFRVVKQ